jgi:hypothetical protein
MAKSSSETQHNRSPSLLHVQSAVVDSAVILCNKIVLENELYSLYNGAADPEFHEPEIDIRKSEIDRLAKRTTTRYFIAAAI